MKKLISYFIGVVMIMVCGIATSCSSNDDDTMSGVYGYHNGTNNGSCYEFINQNSVVFYKNASLTYTAKTYIGKSYGSANADGKILSYTIEGNKIYIPQENNKVVVFKMVGDMLIDDVTSIAYIKNLRPE